MKTKTTRATRRVGSHSQGAAPWTSKKRSKTTRNTYPPNWDEIKARVKIRDNFCCVRCKISEAKAKERGDNLEVDHVTRLADGGTNSLLNLQTLCSTCHRNRLNHRHMRIR